MFPYHSHSWTPCFFGCVVLSVVPKLFLGFFPPECWLSVFLVFPVGWSESCLSVFFFVRVWAFGGCCRLCRFLERPGNWSSCHLSCAVWCVGGPPPRARGRPRVRLEVARAFLWRCVAAIWLSQTYFLAYSKNYFLGSQRKLFFYFLLL